MMVFEHFSALAHAAVAGLGIALLPRFLINMELERETLVVLSTRPTITEMSYYLVTPRKKQNYKPLHIFREWLLATIEQNKDSDNVCNILSVNDDSTELRS
jgi:DNA-binding transcriptional LysR family regulator